ncbi:MAG TPA: hypothetical protein VK678_10035, partial [Bradyrhizobium sp.]|nr:hypothetical protein [Bradyrhizobium sp.]
SGGFETFQIAERARTGVGEEAALGYSAAQRCGLCRKRRTFQSRFKESALRGLFRCRFPN